METVKIYLKTDKIVEPLVDNFFKLLYEISGCIATLRRHGAKIYPNRPIVELINKNIPKPKSHFNIATKLTINQYINNIIAVIEEL